jgi:hypothetical protein
MAAFSEAEIDWRCPDVAAILNQAGILAVLPSEVEALQAWLVARSYELITVDCGLGFAETQRQLGKLFRWEEQFGYRLETGRGNLNALHNGFGFAAAAGGRIALLVLRPDELVDQRAWLMGFLSIAAEHTTYHLALGSRFLTILSLSTDSPLVGAEFNASGIPAPWPLRLPEP